MITKYGVYKSFSIKQVIRSLFKKDIQSLNHITIDKNCISNNFSIFQKLHPKKQIIPVLKSNAYGHGIKQICSILNPIDECRMIAVDSYPEYQIVRDHFQGEILILGQTLPGNYRYFDHKITHFAVWSIEIIRGLIKLDRDIKIHIFINTGMNREGCSIDDISEIIKLVSDYPHIKIVGLMSHLSSADEIDQTATNMQLGVFEKALSILSFYDIHPDFVHIGATGGLMKDVGGDMMTAGRLGIGLYGYSPLSPEDECFDVGRGLQPALSLYSTISAIQHLSEDSGVGYNHTYHTKGSYSKVCTFGVGYFEGLDRVASNNRPIIYNNIAYPIVGRISMNYSTFEVPNYLLIDIGDEICVISNNPSDPNSISQLSKNISTIVYEPLVKLDSSIRRVVV